MHNGGITSGKGAEKPPTNRERQTPMDPWAVTRRRETVPKQPPGNSSAGKHATAQQSKVRAAGAPNLATSSRTSATRRKSKNVNVRRTTAASRMGKVPRGHQQTVNVEHPWAATRRRERRCRNSHREIRAQEGTPPHSGRKPGPSVRPTWPLAPERPRRDARAKT